MGEEHAESYIATARVEFAAGVGQEFRDSAGYGCVQLEQAALVEECGHRRGGDHFGDRGEVEEGFGSDVRVKIPTSGKSGQKWGTRS